MGTSLSGLTPATTFDGLLKTSDNEPLDGTLKAISTGDGTDTILQLSNSALSIGGETTIVGTGNDNTTTSLLVQNSDGANLFKVDDSGFGFYINDDEASKLRFYASGNNALIQGGRNLRIESGGGNTLNITGSGTNGVTIGTTLTNLASNTSLVVRGKGTTSATTSLLVQNSAGTDLLKVTDDGRLSMVGNGFQSLYNGTWGINHTTNNVSYKAFEKHTFQNWTSTGLKTTLLINGSGTKGEVGINNATPTAQLHLKGSGNDATTTALLVQNSDGDDMLKVTDDGITTLGTTGQRGQINLKRPSDGVVIGTIQGTSNGLYLTNQDGSNHILIGTTSTNGVSVGGGTAPTMGARFGIKGSGASSGTTALLVQNSAGTDLLKVADNGDVNIDNGVALDMKVRISPTANKYLEIDRQSRQVRIYSGSGGNAGIFMAQADKFSIGVNNTSLLLLDENSNVRIGSGVTSADTSAKLQVDSTTQGFLPPRMTTTERDLISTPAAGLMVYNTTTNKAQCYNGTAWQDLF